MTPQLVHRLTALATVSAFALATLAPAALAPVLAAPPPIPPRLPQGTPPGRVGRLARIAGTVSHHTADADQWTPALLNTPVTSGDSFWTEPAARADIQVASNRITLAPTTEFDIGTLDDHSLAAAEPQGELFLELRTVPATDSYIIQTPRGAVQITGSGRYDVVAGDTTHPTLVTVVEGAAQIAGPDVALQVGPHQTATITGTDSFQGSVGPLVEDAFLSAMLAADRPARRSGPAIPPIVAGMTGAEDLLAEGDWTDTPQYGAVWYPPVQAGWVPYREGRWSYVGQWGWTWVDQSTWGFAPFHYGRWAQIDDRWGWIPVSPGVDAEPTGPYAVPVYAPALVGFVGLGAVVGAAVGFGAGGPGYGGGSVGWVPLGPREAYYPPYRANLDYVRGINATTVQNVGQTINQTNIVNNHTTVVQNFVNRSAATVVPAATMVQSGPVAAAARPLPSQDFAHAQAQFQSPIRPAAATVGVTPAVARQFNFVAPRTAQPLPGPAIDPAMQHANPGRPFAPSLRAITPVPAGAPPSAAEPARPDTARSPAVPGAELRPEQRPVPAAAPSLRPEPRPEQRPVAPQPAPVPRPAESAVQRPTVPQATVPSHPAIQQPRRFEPPHTASPPVFVAPRAALAPRPVPEFHPAPRPEIHPPAPTFRQPAPAFHPPAPAFHPPAIRPAAPPRPAPPPRPPGRDPHR